jgi:two-component system sensor histidine kinase RpfC
LLAWQGTAEQEQAALRLAIPVTFIGFLLFYQPDEADSHLSHWSIGMSFILAFVVVSAGFLVSTLRHPEPSVLRRVTTIVLDISSLSFGLYLTGGLGAPWFGVYLWVTLGNGFRYGENYLYLSGALSLIGFTTAVTHSAYWVDKQELAIGLGVTLLVIPAYSALLIRRLNEAKRQADEANRAKSEFLSRMSHEIRTPLNGILGMTELMMLGQLNAKERQYINVIDASGKALAHQIDDILDLAKIESGKLTLAPTTFDLYLLLNQTLSMLSPQADRTRTRLIQNIEPHTPFQLIGDPHRIQQVLINLINNAVKFTREGTVVLRVKPVSEAVNATRLRFEIEDDGVGIAADQLDGIFEPFAQAHAGIAQTYGGTGLGTTICKNLVTLMEGDIGVFSEEGEGSTFWFEIPFALPVGSAVSRDWQTRCHTLYVCGAGDQRVRGWLHDSGVPYHEVNSLEHARELVLRAQSSEQIWDAVILDQLPYDDAMHALIHGENDDLNREPLYIVVASKQYPPSAYESKRSLFVVDPEADSAVLNNALHACYVKHSGESVVHIASVQANATAPRRPLKVLIGDDNQTNRMVLQHMVGRLGHVTRLCDGGEAVLSALESDEFDVVIIDKNMPEMGGLEAFTAYRLNHGGTAPVPFVLLTADATEESRSESKRAGIEYFLTKPVSIATLQSTLEKACAAAGTAVKAPRSVPAAVAPADPPTPETGVQGLPHVERQVLDTMIEFAEQPAQFRREIIASFRQDVAEDIRHMSQAILTGNQAGFSDYAHALKGSAAYMGMPRLVVFCESAQHLPPDQFEHQVSAVFREITEEIDAALLELAELPQLRSAGKARKPGRG